MIRHLYILLLASCFITCQAPPPPPPPSPHLLAHRGLSQHAPENTLPAFAAAVDLGLDIEVDVFQTADKQLVVIHDDTVDRTTNGTGKVTEQTLAELRALDAGWWFAPDYRGIQIPTFEEVLRLVKNNQWRETKIAINMKVISPGIEERVVRLVEQYEMIPQVFVFGMNFESTTRFRKANKEIELSVPGWTWDKNGDRKPSQEEVESAHAQGKSVWVISSCINYFPDRWDNARATGVDGFLTNYPLEARELWRKAKGQNNTFTYPQEKATAPPKTGPKTRRPTSRPAILAHQGLQMYAPENTLPAIAAAASLGFGIELPVRRSKDNKLVVIKDATLDRTTNGTDKVEDQTLAELRALDAGSWFDPAYKGAKIPTLAEALKTIRARQWRPVLVSIPLQTKTAEIKEQIVNLVKEQEMMDQIFFAGNEKDSLGQWWLADESAFLKKEQAQITNKTGRKIHLSATLEDFTVGEYEGGHLLAWRRAKELELGSLCVSHPLALRRFWDEEEE